MLGVCIFLLIALVACELNLKHDTHEPWCPWEEDEDEESGQY